LALLAKQVEQLLKTKEFLAQGYDQKKIATYFKLPLFIGEKLARQSRNFSAAALSQAVVDLAEADYFLKSGRSGVYVLEKIMIELCNDS
jgi:DNA polymerase-3 subunit delta